MGVLTSEEIDDGLKVTVDHKRHLVVRGEWTPGQVYEVRVGALVDKDHHALARTAPLAPLPRATD